MSYGPSSSSGILVRREGGREGREGGGGGASDRGAKAFKKSQRI